MTTTAPNPTADRLPLPAEPGDSPLISDPAAIAPIDPDRTEDNSLISVRPRRLRRSATLRRMVAETVLTPQDLIYPVFVTEGEGVTEAIASMPDCFRYSIDQTSCTNQLEAFILQPLFSR